jgi:hypothetical protein
VEEYLYGHGIVNYIDYSIVWGPSAVGLSCLWVGAERGCWYYSNHTCGVITYGQIMNQWPPVKWYFSCLYAFGIAGVGAFMTALTQSAPNNDPINTYSWYVIVGTAIGAALAMGKEKWPKS